MKAGCRGRWRTLAVVCAALTSLLAAPPPAGADDARVSAAPRPAVDSRDADFNGDGYADIAVSDTFDEGDTGYEGAVHILYGTAAGLTAQRAQYWTEDQLGGEGHRWDFFGGALAAGNFDADAFTDLAIAIPQAELAPPFGDEGGDQGLVRIVYGSPEGLTPARSQLWNWSRMHGGADLGEHFGEALVAGNFGRGQQDDLAISADNDTVAILYGTTTGLQSAGHQLWSLDSPGIIGTPGTGDTFGADLVAGNFGRGEHADLAISIPEYRVGSKSGAGAVSVVYGSSAGLSAARNQLWTQNSRGIKGRAEANDQFGAEIAAGRLRGGSYDALAIGVPYEKVRGKDGAGAVNVIYGSASGLGASGDQIWSQASRGIPGANEKADEFGSALTIGNYGRNTGLRAYDDLAVGAYNETVGGVERAGSVTVIYGSSTGLRRTGSRAITQKTSGVPGRPNEQASFGESLGSADVVVDTGPSFDELLVGMHVGLDWRSGEPYSAVLVAAGSASGVNTQRCQIWTAAKLGRHNLAEDLGFGDPIEG